ncbi:mannonate dehydratase [uncultured Cohaesibacter sp.]|uniref:mannonate dehydratase n=1 Tax=uncultured Cohaesibacter sp. TaxID=1002546 RepID=UPI00292ECA34|nr:mannonate dehydratase [uncultured Cohaesibacter sp.]
MYIGEQLINPSDDRLRLSAQLGSEAVIIDTRPNYAVLDEAGLWSGAKIARERKRIENYGMKLDGMALDLGSLLLDSLRAPEKAKARAAQLRQHIKAAAEGGCDLVKFTVAMVGITRTGVVEGRGGMQCSTFRASDYHPETDARFSYWGTVLPEDGKTKPSEAVYDPKKQETGGQRLAGEVGGISAQEGWKAIQFLVEQLLPTAEKEGVRLACHPHDPAYPAEGLNGVHHVLGSIEGMKQFLSLAPGSPYLGFNFCQGTIAEMSSDPNAAVLEAIRTFGPMGKIFMVHFRNIKGGFLDFREAMPDEGSVDMAQAIRAYREVGYEGVLCPDHVPLSEQDPERERFFAYCLGYTKALLQTA